MNIYDNVYADPRFMALAEELGSQQLAIGALVTFWRATRNQWISSGGNNGIPKSRFMKVKNWPAILECGLAVEHDGEIYAKGGRKNFDWGLIQRERGKKSAEKRWGECSEKKQEMAQKGENKNRGYKNVPPPEHACGKVGEAPEIIENGDNHLSLSLSLDRSISNNLYSQANIAPKLSKADPLPPDFELADKWLAHSKSICGSGRFKRDQFAKAIRRMKNNVVWENQETQTKIAIDDEMAIAIFDWIKADEFWRDKALSPVSLFKPSSKTGVRKIDTILSQIYRAKKKQYGIHAAAHRVATGEYIPPWERNYDDTSTNG